MAKSTNIQNLESMLNEAQIEKEINSILEELGTNDAPEAVESGEADEKEFSADKKDWFDKEENSDDVKEVIVEAEDAEEDDDSDKADKSEDDEEKDSKEDESEDDEKDSDDEEKDDEKSEDKEEDSLKEDEELSTNDAPQAVEAGAADEKAFDANEQDYFPGEENADDVASDKANSENQLKESVDGMDVRDANGKEVTTKDVKNMRQYLKKTGKDKTHEIIYTKQSDGTYGAALRLKEDEELSTNDAPQAVESGSADEKEFSANKEDWFNKEENADDVVAVLVETMESMSDGELETFFDSLTESELITLDKAMKTRVKRNGTRARIYDTNKPKSTIGKANLAAEVSEAVAEEDSKKASPKDTKPTANAKDSKAKEEAKIDKSLDRLNRDKNIINSTSAAQSHKISAEKYEELVNKARDAKKRTLDKEGIASEAKQKYEKEADEIKNISKHSAANKVAAKAAENERNNTHWIRFIKRHNLKKNIAKYNDAAKKYDETAKSRSEQNTMDRHIADEKEARQNDLRNASDNLMQSKERKVINSTLHKERMATANKINKEHLREMCGFTSDEELINFLEDNGFVYTEENFMNFCEAYGISEDYVDENPELVDAQEAGFDDGEADETIVPAVTPEVEEDVVSESFSSIFSILDSINEELSTNDAPQAVEAGEADEESFDASEDEVFEGEEEADDVKEVVTESEDKEESDEDDSKDDEKSKDEEDEKDSDEDKEESDEDDSKDDEKSEDEAIKEDAQGQGETSEDKQFDVDATLASDAAAEIGTEENQDDIKDQEEECASCKNESYSSFEEAISLGAEYFAEEEHKNRLIEQVALSIANENGDRLFKEMVEATVLATRLQEAIIAKYNRTATARVQNLIEDMELSTNDAPKAVEAGEADEKAFDADENDYFPGEENADDVASDKANSDNQLKEDEELGVNDAPEAVSSANPDEKAFDADEQDYFPGEENADDVASDKANSDNQLKEDEELGTNDAPQAVKAGEADEESFDASEDEVFDDEDADDVGEVVVESFTDDMIMDFLTESEMFDATENNVRKIRNAINEGTIANFYNGELNEDMNNWYHEKKISTLVKKIEKLKLKIANEKDPYKKDKLQAKYEKLIQRLDYHKNAYIPEKKSGSVNESVRKPRIATTASEKNNK